MTDGTLDLLYGATSPSPPLTSIFRDSWGMRAEEFGVSTNGVVASPSDALDSRESANRKRPSC